MSKWIAFFFLISYQIFLADFQHIFTKIFYGLRYISSLVLERYSQTKQEHWFAVLPVHFVSNSKWNVLKLADICTLLHLLRKVLNWRKHSVPNMTCGAMYDTVLHYGLQLFFFFRSNLMQIVVVVPQMFFKCGLPYPKLIHQIKLIGNNFSRKKKRRKILTQCLICISPEQQERWIISA